MRAEEDGATGPSQIPRRALRAGADIVVTLVLWAYFTIGFLLFFSPFYLVAGRFSRRRESAFQWLHCQFLRVFFFLVRLLIPGHRWHISEGLRDIRSSVIVCNHLSYLDPILLISLYEKHTTIVKSRLFHVPIFGRVLEWSGYIPSAAEGRLTGLMIDRIEAVGDFLASGGNLIVFPEGTRSRDGRMGRLNSGAFKIARRLRAPIRVLCIRNTDRMFEPGRILFHTRGPNTITVERIVEILPEPGTEPPPVSEVVARVQALMETHVTSASKQPPEKRI